MANITFTFGTGKQYADLPSAWAAIPSDVVASGNSYTLLGAKQEFTVATGIVLNGKTTDATHTITIDADVGCSFMDNASIASTAYVYNSANGTSFTSPLNNGEFSQVRIRIDCSYVTVRRLQFTNFNNNSNAPLSFSSNSIGCLVELCILENSSTSNNNSCLIADGVLSIRNCLIVNRSSTASALGAVQCFGNGSSMESTTIVRPASLPAVGAAFNYGNFDLVKNCLALNFSKFSDSNIASSTNNAFSGTLTGGTSNLQNVSFAATVVDTGATGLGDFRTKAGAATIDAGTTPSAGNTVAPNGVRQQGTSADIGAWEYPNVVVAPTVSITSISVTGQTVVISGVTTGTPTSGTASIASSGGSYNGASPQGPFNLTLGSGTFTVTFSSVVVGAYQATVTVANSSYNATTTGAFNVNGALATSLIQDPVDGQVLTIHGTTSGSPTSGSIIVPPAATNPSGAVQQNASLTLGSGTFSVSVTLQPGNYDAGILRLTTSAGTSLPQSGTSAVSVMGFSGNPEAPSGDGSNPAPTVTNVAVSPSTATGSTNFTATVSGTNSPSQAVTWSATAGSITSGGVFTAPSATGSTQTITVTATSVADNTKSGTATVTIAASTGSTVTGVSVSPSTATVNGGSTRQFSATVSGTNSPSQAVNWTANGGSVSSAGLFTAPVATTSAQTFTVTATSVADGSKSGSATVTVPALAAATRTITMPLATGVDIFNQPIPAVNLSGLSVAIYAQSTPGSASTVLYQTEAGTTNGSGVFSASFQTLLQAGALVLVVILMPDGRHCASKVAIA